MGCPKNKSCKCGVWMQQPSTQRPTKTKHTTSKSCCFFLQKTFSKEQQSKKKNPLKIQGVCQHTKEKHFCVCVYTTHQAQPRLHIKPELCFFFSKTFSKKQKRSVTTHAQKKPLTHTICVCLCVCNTTQQAQPKLHNGGLEREEEEEGFLPLLKKLL